MVLVSDGLPIEGPPVVDGRYQTGTNYGCCNAVFELASFMKEEYYMYTLGFYHGITEADIEFAQQFMKDLASSPSNYYHVEDADDLEFVFGDVAGDITSDSYPIIIVPGITETSA